MEKQPDLSSWCAADIHHPIHMLDEGMKGGRKSVREIESALPSIESNVTLQVSRLKGKKRWERDTIIETTQRK